MTTHTADGGRIDRESDTVTVPVAPPRDPSAYRATAHFRNRIRERVDDVDRDELPRTLIEDGRVARVAGDGADVPADERGATVAFTTTGPRARPWTLVAALRPVAFERVGERHRALTIFQWTPTRRDDVDGAGGDDA
jgi:hypothetical protein